VKAQPTQPGKKTAASASPNSSWSAKGSRAHRGEGFKVSGMCAREPRGLLFGGVLMRLSPKWPLTCCWEARFDIWPHHVAVSIVENLGGWRNGCGPTTTKKPGVGRAPKLWRWSRSPVRSLRGSRFDSQCNWWSGPSFCFCKDGCCRLSTSEPWFPM
jgi:hypothetical protein